MRSFVEEEIERFWQIIKIEFLLSSRFKYQTDVEIKCSRDFIEEPHE